MTNPVILVTSDVIPYNNYNWHGAIDIYPNAVAHVGAVPVVLPSFGPRTDFESLFERFDGILVTGSRSNVHPSLYGKTPGPEYEPYDQDRDATTIPLICKAIEAGVPLLAICRGMQELNVALGGTLITEAQEQPDRMDHRAVQSEKQDERFAMSHNIHFETDTELSGIVGGPTLKVNSLHRQVIDKLADRLIVEATAEDGTIEAVRVEDARAFAYGVQWHPEYWVASDAPSRQLFEAFADAARQRQMRGSAIAAE